MKNVVLKFGGTSVGSIDRIKNVAKIIATYKRKKFGVIVVSSAMSGTTNQLIKQSNELSKNFDPAEYDVLLSTGEQAACALIAGRLKHLGFKARSWTSWQVPIITGFQGINSEDRVTTLGRGGTDASAIMLAKFFNADACDVYTDVDGVYTCLLYTSPSPRDGLLSRMPSSA